MKIIFFLLLFLSVAWTKESCYTVQLTSVYKTEQSYKEISSKEYDASCKIMEIGANVAVRCGCYEKFSEAKKRLPAFKRRYKEAYIMSTYKSRFTVVKKEETISDDNVTKAEIPKVVVPKVVPKASELIVSPIASEVVIGEKAVAKKSRPKKVKVVVKKKKEKKKKEKRKKKEKKSKVKYVKKTEAHYRYQRYLKKLKNRRGIKPYDYKYRFGAQFSYDVAYIDTADKSYFANEWRRVRIYHRGSFFDAKLFYEMEYSFTGNNHYKDNFVGYQDSLKLLDTDYRVKVGNLKIPFSLDSYSSSKNITFMERALTDAFAETRKVGVELLLHKKIGTSYINLFGAGFANSIDQRVRDEVNQPGFATRFTFAQKFSKQHLLSIGGAYYRADMRGESVKFNESAGSKLMNKKYISASVKKVDILSKKNIEALYIYKNYSLQGEYTLASLDAVNKNDFNKLSHYNFYGFYLQGSYFPIGVGRKYKFSNATLGKIKPKSEGALEFALRYSYLNLNDGDEDNNGMQSDYNFAINWYMSREVRFMFNYIVSYPQKTKEYDGMLQIAQARVLFAF